MFDYKLGWAEPHSIFPLSFPLISPLITHKSQSLKFKDDLINWHWVIYWFFEEKLIFLIQLFKPLRLILINKIQMRYPHCRPRIKTDLGFTKATLMFCFGLESTFCSFVLDLNQAVLTLEPSWTKMLRVVLSVRFELRWALCRYIFFNFCFLFWSKSFIYNFTFTFHFILKLGDFPKNAA